MLRRPAGDGRRRSSETAQRWVVVDDERHDPVDQLGDRGERPTLEQPPGKDREEQLRLVQPGGVTACSEGETAGACGTTSGWPAPHARSHVENDMHVQLAGDPGVQLAQEGDEVRCGVVVQLRGLVDPAAGHIQRGQQVRGAMSDVLVFLASGPAGCRRRRGLGAAARADPGLLIDCQHQRAVGRIEVQPADVGGPLPNPGTSRRVIQPRTRCGLMSRSARIRPTWDAEMPMSPSASASWAWLQWLAGSGGSRVTVATIRSRSSWP
jgi:hypothetical protein